MAIQAKETAMTSMTETGVATQTYCVYVKATPEAIWDAITNPEQTDRYGYRGRAEYELRPGGAYRAHASDEMRAMGAADVVVEGEVLEVEPGRKLVQTWHALFDPQTTAEPAKRLTWDLEEGQVPWAPGATKLTLTHELDGAPSTAAIVGGAVPGAGGGWAYVLSDLKSLLETGSSLAG
jgi:uncharacterized protein YndB with AHSA1/START domain